MKRFLLSLLLLCLCSCAPAANAEVDLTFTERELSGTWDARGAVTITGEGDTCRISGKNAALEGNVIRILEDGVYVFSGTFTNMRVVVAAGEKDKVQLVLSGAEITSPDGPAICAESADKVFITLAEATNNRLLDSAVPTDEALDAAIFSRADLCINGTGTLTVQGLYKHGVVSKDDLIIVDANLTVEARSTALDGKDCVMLRGVSAAITAGSNGVRSDNTEDEGRGYIYFQDSHLSITAGTDGIDAAAFLRADNADLTIRTGEGSTSVTHSSQDMWGGFGWYGGASEESTGSWKGLKASGDIEIHGGRYNIDSQDDCIHTNSNLTITGGSFSLLSSDDGIHADNELLISGGDFTIGQSFEGIEASKLTISGGHIDITASDDGLNAAGGADGSASANRWGRGMFSNMIGEIVISGGYIHINANGDGIDSNNTILVSGGVTLVSGSPSSGNAAFDYDGEATVTGGVLIAVGGSGMAQSFTQAENQGCMLFGINGAQGGMNLAIADENGQIVAAYTPRNSYSAVVVTAPQLQLGRTYTVVMDASITGADENGFASGTAYTGGTALGAIEMTSLLQGGSGHSMGGGFGGGGGGGPRRPGR